MLGRPIRLKEDGYWGLYRGQVIDNVDPLKSGRVKIKVYGFYDSMNEQDMPWAEPMFPYGGTSGIGASYIPPRGAISFIMFDGGDPECPIYMGASPMEGMIPAEANEEGRYMIIKTPKGAKILVSEKDNEGIHIVSSGGAIIELDDVTNRVRIRDHSGSYIEMSGGDIIIQAKRTLHLNPGSLGSGSGRIVTTAPRIKDTTLDKIKKQVLEETLSDLTELQREGKFIIKDSSITLESLQQEGKDIITAAVKVYPGVPVLTSTTGDVHMASSKHYTGEAIDLRTKNIRNPSKVAKDLQDELGEKYDVVLESDHIHVEFDPDKKAIYSHPPGDEGRNVS